MKLENSEAIASAAYELRWTEAEALAQKERMEWEMQKDKDLAAKLEPCAEGLHHPPSAGMLTETKSKAIGPIAFRIRKRGQPGPLDTAHAQ